MIGGASRGIAGDDEMIADAQRPVGHTLGDELAGTAPLDRVADIPAVGLAYDHLDERVRVPQLELDELAFNGDPFVLEVGRRERMVRLHGGAEDTRGQQRYRDHDSFHASTPSLTPPACADLAPLEHTIGAAGAQLKIS